MRHNDDLVPLLSTSRRRILAPLTAFVLALVTVYVLGPRDFMTGDTTHYLAMARGEAAPAPFAYRLLTPALVALLPGSPGSGFFLIAYLSTLGTLWLTFRLLRHFDISQAAAIATCVCLCFSYPLANYLGRWGRIDPLANFLFALALFWILRYKLVPAVGVLTIGILAKETLILLLPILCWQKIHSQPSNPRAWGAAAALCLLPIGSLVTVRSVVDVAEGSFTVESPADLPRVLGEVWAYNVDQFGFSKRVARDLTKSYGFFWALAALGLLVEHRLRRDGLALISLYLIAIGFGLCLVATDWARMLGTGFWGVFIPVAFFFDRIYQRPSWRPLLTGFVALSILQCYLSLLIYRDLDDGGQLAMVATQILVVLVGASLAVWASFCRGQRHTAVA